MSVSPRDESILKAVATVIREHVDKAYDALWKKITLLKVEVDEIRHRVSGIPVPEKGEKGDPGQSITLEDVLPALKQAAMERVATFLEDLVQPQDGKSVTLDEVRPLIEAGMDRWALDFERRAQDVLQRAIDRMHPTDGRDGRDGIDGKDADPDQVAARVIERLDLTGTSEADVRKLCRELVALEVEAFPRPRDGVDGLDGRDGKDAPPITDAQIAAAVAKYLQDNPPAAGRDGVDGQDGTDGQDGIDGKSVDLKDVEGFLAARADSWALDFEKRAQITLQRAVDAVEKPKDGRDGFSLDDFELRSDDGGRTIVMTFDDGHRHIERSLVTETQIYRGIYAENEKYTKGDGVTWGGSMWIAERNDPIGKPGQYNKHWRLVVKRGRDGKDGQ